VLDFAGGSGRNLPPLLARGADVTLADREPLAPPGVRTLAADLERGPLPFEGRRFDAVVCCNYLFRPRLALLLDLVDAGGLLVYETFARGNERYGRPATPDFLLARGELLRAAAAAGLTVLAFEDGFVETPRPAMIQRICALRPPLSEQGLRLVG
jgi:hypothetical protein